jgi:DNA polymerase I
MKKESKFKIFSQHELVRDSVSFDMEWIPFTGPYWHHKTRILAASFCTNTGERIVLHINNYKDNEKALVIDIVKVLSQFNLVFVWFGTNIARYKYNESTLEYVKLDGIYTDYFILHQRCLFYGIFSPIRLLASGRTALLKNEKKITIDLGKVFDKQIIKGKGGLLKGRYRTSHLDEVGSALLGISKLENSSGKDFQSLPLDKQIKYAARDAEIPMMLTQYNNCLVLRVMKLIAEYSEVHYQICCFTNKTWWDANIYDNMLERGEITLEYTPDYRLPKKQFGGGHQFPSKAGFYVGIPIDELDVKGEYPTLVIKHNISHDTLNCTCCQGNDSAYLERRLMDAINKRLTKKGEPPRTEKYWTCRIREGALPKLVKRFLKERKRCQEVLIQEHSKPIDKQNPAIIEEYDARQQTAKLLANAAFGVYGNPNFKYANYRVAETITAAGWLIHEEMIKLCSDDRYGFEVVFGFTDGILVKNATYEKIDQYIRQAKQRLDVEIEHKNRFLNTMIFLQMNRYLAWSGRPDEKPIIKNIDGMSKRSPKWVQKYIEKIATSIITNPAREQILIAVSSIMQEAFSELESYLFKQENQDLRFSSRVSQDLDKYKSKTCQTVILAKEQEAASGNVIFWYIADSTKTPNGKSYSSDATCIDIIGYEKWLWNKIKLLLIGTHCLSEDDLRALEKFTIHFCSISK